MTCPGLQQRIFGSPVSRPDHYLMALHAGLDGSVWLPPPTTNTSNDQTWRQMSISVGTFWRLQSYLIPFHPHTENLISYENFGI